MFYIRRPFAVLRHLRPKTPFERATAALNRGRARDALQMFDALLAGARQASVRARVHSKRAVAFIALGRRDDARAALNAALTEDERCAPALVNYGNMLL